MNLKYALNCYKLVRKNSDLRRSDAIRLVKNYLADKGSICEVPGLDRPYFFEKDFATMLFGHSSIKRIQNIVKSLPSLPERSLVIDVGANNGWFTSCVAQLYPEMRPHLFEPNRGLSLAIEKNMSVPNVDYSLSHDALSNEIGAATLYVPEVNSQHGSLFLENATYASRSGAEISRLSVNTNTMDNYLADRDIDKVDFLKVDIQGAELNFLLGAVHALKSTQMALVEVSFLDGKLDETLTILHKEFPKYKVMAPVQYGADVLFYR